MLAFTERERRSRTALIKGHEVTLALVPRHISICCIRKPQHGELHWSTLSRKMKQKIPHTIAVYPDWQVHFYYGSLSFHDVKKKYSWPPLTPAYICIYFTYVHTCVYLGFATVTWFLSAITVHKGLRVTKGAMHHCEDTSNSHIGSIF